MKLIVGLGNPGSRYVGSRHNLGFMVVDNLANRWGIIVNMKKHRSILGEGVFAGIKVMIVKPQTYMNKSGEAVLEIVNYYRDKIDDIIIIHDDLDLDFGRIRFRENGGTGGHRGLGSITNLLNSSEYPRLKIGIGHPIGQVPVEAYVLNDFLPQEKQMLPNIMEACLDGLECWCKEGVLKSMNDFNSKTFIENE
ncbi:MAG: aminoacyl-tRNA hydrolase [Firmicutes bacterium HGW-Firmicutes-12]|jgi:PTH1 family peptidyl-tRNA hydrolase|nr:MAG: aminoacyl-tRNA hydrolase [Firmicutes bacterium HGW-Firmicutes-12]